MNKLLKEHSDAHDENWGWYIDIEERDEDNVSDEIVIDILDDEDNYYNYYSSNFQQNKRKQQTDANYTATYLMRISSMTFLSLSMTYLLLYML